MIIFCFRLNILTSKTLNLLFIGIYTLGAKRAERAGVCESYPTGKIPNKYINDVF